MYWVTLKSDKSFKLKLTLHFPNKTQNKQTVSRKWHVWQLYLHGTISGWYNGNIFWLIGYVIGNVQRWCQLSEDHVTIKTKITASKYKIKILHSNQGRNVSTAKKNLPFYNMNTISLLIFIALFQLPNLISYNYIQWLFTFSVNCVIIITILQNIINFSLNKKQQHWFLW